MNVNSYYTRPWILNSYHIGPIATHLTQCSEFLAKQATPMQLASGMFEKLAI